MFIVRGAKRERRGTNAVLMRCSGGTPRLVTHVKLMERHTQQETVSLAQPKPGTPEANKLTLQPVDLEVVVESERGERDGIACELHACDALPQKKSREDN